MSKTIVAARRYTLAEVDALRAAVRKRLTVLTPVSLGTSDPSAPNAIGYTSQAPDMLIVEEHVRTAMMAGIAAEEYAEEQG